MQSVTKTFANKAATDLSAKDGYVAKYDTGGMNVCSAITDQGVGVISKGGDTTVLQSEVVIHGEALAKLGGTVTAGQHVTPHTDGTVVASAGAGCTEFGLALESGIAGDWVRVFVFGGNKQWA
jgi:hypothetical protein